MHIFKEGAIKHPICKSRFLFLLIAGKPGTTSISFHDGQGLPKEGTDYTLSCELDDEGLPSPGLHDYTWWRNDNQLLKEKSQNLTQSLDHTLHDGTYTCAASNTAGMETVSQGYQLQVYCK